MTTVNQYGKYIPDLQKLKDNASCQKEIDYINGVEQKWEQYKGTKYEGWIGFAFNMCYVMQQACGHFEIFQTHVNNEQEALEWLELMKTESKTRKCTKCICHWEQI